MKTLRLRFSSVSVRNVPFDELDKALAKAVEHERYEDAALLKYEKQRRERFRKNYKDEMPSGRWYAWYGWTEPIHEQSLRRSGKFINPPFAIFASHLEAAEWLDPGKKKR